MSDNMEPPPAPPIIGIDLGTTYSAIACYRFNRVEIIGNENSERIIPSLVYYNPNTGESFVGSAAYDESSKYPTNLLRDSKRTIGRKFDDESFETFKKQQLNCSYGIVKDDDGDVAFEVTICQRKILKKPEEVSAEILKYLKSMAEELLNESVTEAVISIPAYFSNAQRKATKKAAELAGLKVTKLITEPVAGAITYVNDRNSESKLMVFDWGGGTLDISFIEVNNKMFEVKGVYGDTILGGRNIDGILFNHFNVPVQSDPERFHRRLLQQCILIKKRLSTQTEADSILEYYDGKNDLPLKLSRNTFETIIEDILKKAMDIVEHAIDDMNWSKSDINEVLLVGGSTRIPKIRKMLEDYFGKEKIKKDLYPDEAVASGACIQAASLRKLKNLERYKITEVTPLSIGVERQFGLMLVIIPKNSKLPAEATLNSTTSDNNQTSGGFNVYEGERTNVKYNNKLAECIVDGLPPKRAREVKFQEIYHLDEDGILKINIIIPCINKSEKTVKTLQEYRMSPSRIAYSIEDAKKMKHEDELFEKFVRFLNNSRQYCNDILYDINKISSEGDKAFVKERCEQFMDSLKHYIFTELEDVERNFLKLKNDVRDILLTNSMLGLEL